MKKERFIGGMLCCAMVLASCLMFGCGSSSSSHDDVGFLGRAIDGALANAIVYIDKNGNGELDAGEPNTTSNETGNFRLVGDIAEGETIVVESGSNTIDIATNKPFVGKMKSKAPATTSNELEMNTIIVSPVSTLVVAGEDAGKTEADVLKALGLEGIADIYAFDPLANTTGDSSALALAYNSIQTKIVSAVNVTVGAVTGAGENLDSMDIFASALNEFAKVLDANAPLTSSNIGAHTNTVIQATGDAATAAGGTVDDTKLAAAKSSCVSLVTEFANEVDDAVTGGSTAEEILTNLAKVNGAATDLIDTIEDAVDGGTIDDIDDAAADLENNVDNQTTGNVLPDPPTPGNTTGSTGTTS